MAGTRLPFTYVIGDALREARQALEQLFEAGKVHDPDDWSGEPAMIKAAEVLGKSPFGTRP